MSQRQLNKLLHNAVIHGFVKAANKHIKTGADVNSYDGGVTPLIEAVRQGNDAMVSLLLDHKADINQESESGETPLQWGILCDKTSVVELLLSRGVDKDVSLLAASRKGHVPTFQRLLEFGADLDCVDLDDKTVIDKAELYGNQNILDFIRCYKEQQSLSSSIANSHRSVNNIEF